MHPPEQSDLLYGGLVDPFVPDLVKYPRYAEATPVEFVLEPGDIVIWSAGWWHATEALEDSLAIAQNILNEHNYEDFRRTSQAACRPGGSHGIHSPWCACFRRCYGAWNRMYEDWKRAIADREKYEFRSMPRVLPEEDVCAPELQQSGIAGVLETVENDIAQFYRHNDYDKLVSRSARGIIKK